LQRVHEHGVGLDYVVLAAVTVMTTTVRVSRGVGFVRRDFDSGARGPHDKVAHRPLGGCANNASLRHARTVRPLGVACGSTTSVR
jgi:hypothetical protein